jgi:hypothetical protein
MIARILIVVVVIAASFSGVTSASAVGYTAAERAAIRSMPITQRPNRPGHVYGNSVRLLHRIRTP